MSKTAVVALGGNALTQEGQDGTQEEQYANAIAMAKSVRSLLRQGWKIIIVHGNGPQVGNLAIQHEEGAKLVPAQPLFALGAMTQGALGSLISLAMHEICGEECSGIVSVVTHVVVDPNDPAFENPTKPIGPFFSEAESKEFSANRGWSMIQDSGRGYRRVVPSPEPKATLEANAIAQLTEAGNIVVAAGGGGIPVMQDGGIYKGVDAVVDKDFAAERIADAANADALVMVTGVPTVMLDFGKPTQRAVENLTVSEARQHLEDGQFPPGSMGPKMEAAMKFVNGDDSNPNRLAAITTPELVYGTLAETSGGVVEGGVGTCITTDEAIADRSNKEVA
ncbi:Carbamate kinase 1 [Ruegeria sp. THAF57]|uniref:carbamate kinase n=1 Tax=Ruegeria sp. THAF57 TaxID=2744555 RepID=UPI0015DF0ED1|nr:carbamate kinase [Ruegeria sp. THAF57]CAD0186822.1 Carbamate kinase 1 [Ruegeria sp. THAF57]